MAPLLSFVVPVRNDADRLGRCLASIRASTRDIDSEIIVADNGSTDGSARVAREAGAQVLEMPHRRVADLRNAAALCTRAELLAFVDADHELDAGWSSAALGIFADPSVIAAGCPYRAPSEGTWVQRMYDRFRRHEPGCREVDWLPSGNLIVRRAAFAQVGGFDATLETCEDVDLCQRLRRHGGRLVAADSLRSIHRGDPSTLKALFLGELWRGRDNLRVSLRAPLTFRSIPSLAIPLLNLFALGAIVIGLALWGRGGRGLAAGGVATFVLLTGVRAVWLLASRDGSPGGGRLAGQAVIVAAVYETARALALVSRSGHDVRRRT